jgi:hypothetical protein
MTLPAYPYVTTGSEALMTSPECFRPDSQPEASDSGDAPGQYVSDDDLPLHPGLPSDGGLRKGDPCDDGGDGDEDAGDEYVPL